MLSIILIDVQCPLRSNSVNNIICYKPNKEHDTWKMLAPAIQALDTQILWLLTQY